MSETKGFGDYLKAAFLQQWNLLYLFGAVGVTILSPGIREVVFALAAAGELTLLAAMVGNDRFRRLVNSQAGNEENTRSSAELTRRFNTLYMGLSKESKDRFDALKHRCESMRAAGVSESDIADSGGIDKVAASQLQGVNRMLWVFLKLLHTHGALLQFLKSTDEREIIALEEAAKSKLSELPETADDDLTIKKRKSLEDTLKTALARKENLQHAKENLDYVQLELARIASKVAALSEMMVARHDPSMITSEVDDAARSVETTEQAIGELRMFNGLTAEDTNAPPILMQPAPRVRG